MSSATMTSPPIAKQQQQQPLRLSSLWAASLAWCFVFLLTAWAIFELKPPDAVLATSSQNDFSAERAMTHVRAISGAPHPIGSAANDAVREYIVAQLSSLGIKPQTMTAIGLYNRSRIVAAGVTRDIVARIPGTADSGAILMMSHYDSVPNSPGGADDGAGVAALLEMARAVRNGRPLRNDLILLFTDGEEAGLLGAEAFVASQSLVKDVGLAMNFEARGDSGPSLLFETSVNNASLITEVAQAAPCAMGSSLFYSLYKLLPNDTDFTALRPAGISGLNFAFGNGLEVYHSSRDTADNLEVRSLQHHGSYALALVRHFGQMDLSKFKRDSGDAVFFNWPGGGLIAFHQRAAVFGEVVVTILLTGAIVLTVRRRQIEVRRLASGVLACFSILLVVPLGMTACSWLLLQLLHKRLLLGDTPSNSLLLTSLVLLGAVLGSTALAKFRSNRTFQELSMAGLVLVCILSWIPALFLPAASYLLLCPLMLTALGVASLQLAGMNSSRAWMVSTLPGCVMAILLFAPLAYLIYVFLTLNLMCVAAIGLLIGFFFLIGIPLMDVAAARCSWRRISASLAAAAGVCLALGIMQSHSSLQHPRRDSLIYSLNSDTHNAVWISYDNAIDAFTSHFIPGSAKPAIVPDSPDPSRPVLSGPAPVFELQPPIVEIKADERNSDGRTVNMIVRSQREANLIALSFDANQELSSLKISGRNVDLRRNWTGLILLYGMGAQGADLEFKAKGSSGLSFWISDSSLGLPTSDRRPPDIIAGQSSDQTMVARKYVLNTP